MNIKRKIAKRLVYCLDKIGLLKPQSFYDIPIIINNFNRLSMLKKLIRGLEQRGYTNIWIIDNNSTYPPLLEWMNAMNDKYHFVRLQTNVGHLSLFETGLYQRFWKGYYVYTDSDISIPDYVPADFVESLWNVMQRFPKMEKCGCALSINDIPDSFQNKHKVIDWEKQFWNEEICENVYRGGVDTTFALYRPLIIPYLSNHVNCRVAGDLTLKHEPWYVDSSHLDDEENYYIEHCKTSTHWTTHKA